MARGVVAAAAAFSVLGLFFHSELFALGNATNLDRDIAFKLIKECPVTNCYGVNCTIVKEFNDCDTCACPIGSRSRGCDEMPIQLQRELWTKGCPSLSNPSLPRYRAQPVFRWYRHVDFMKRIDECRTYVFPYCSDFEKNVWPSPRTRQECLNMCFRVKQLFKPIHLKP